MKNSKKEVDYKLASSGDPNFNQNLANESISWNRLLKPVLFAVFALLLEIVNFFCLYCNNSSYSSSLLPSYFVFDACFIVMIGVLIYAVKPNWVSNIVYYFFLGFQLVVNVVNSILCKSSSTAFSFNLFKLTQEGFKAFNISFIDWTSIILNFALLALIIFSQVMIDKKLKFKCIKASRLSKIALSVCLIFSCYTLGISTYAIQISNMDENDSKYYYSNLNFSLYSLQKFGTYGFYAKSLYNSLFKNTISSPTVDASEVSSESNIVSQNEDATLYGDNVIIIMLESFEWFGIDPYNTPTLWSIYENSLKMTNYYSNNKTNISEDICLLGYMPFDFTIYDVQEDMLAVQYSLPNVFKNSGYTTSYFHSYLGSFYNRDTVNKALGFDNLYFLDDVDFDGKYSSWGDWNKESDYLNEVLEYIAPSDGTKFMSFYLTVSTHGGYGDTLENFEEYYDIYDENLDEFIVWLEESGYYYPEDENSQQYLKEYKAATIDTDKMFETLLEYLNSTELEDGTTLMDNTTLIIYSDHNAYFNNLSYTLKGTSSNEQEMKINYNVPFMIYSTKIDAGTYDSFCDSYDLYPTICDLFGLEYSTYFTVGYSIFDESEPYHVYYSMLTGIYTEDAYTPNMQDYYLYNEDLTDEELETIKQYVTEMYEKLYDLDELYNSKLTC